MNITDNLDSDHPWNEDLTRGITAQDTRPVRAAASRNDNRASAKAASERGQWDTAGKS